MSAIKGLLTGGLGALLCLQASGGIAAQTVVSPTVDFATRYHSSPPGSVIVPNSGIAQKGQFRTHLKLMVPPAGVTPPKLTPGALKPLTGAPFPGYFINTPASLACIYGLAAPTSGCNPNVVSALSKGGSRAIAIVDAYHYPTALNDLNFYSAQFGLPQMDSTNFVQTWIGSQPVNDFSGWSLEGALDIEMVHSMAPKAKIFYVEAQSALESDLFAAVTLATQLVAQAGGGQVSMSWGGDESSTDVLQDSVFTPPANPNFVTYFASSGDSGDFTSPGFSSAAYPAYSPQVLSVGGTSTVFDPNGNFVAHKGWQSSGTGLSTNFSRPAFQNSVSGVVGGRRGVPDVSAVANPATGVWVFNSYLFGAAWFITGGTSVASPVVAGLVNAANLFAANTNALLTLAYGNATNPAFFTDVTYGFCGPYEFYDAGAGYDLCTGLGTPK